MIATGLKLAGGCQPRAMCWQVDVLAACIVHHDLLLHNMQGLCRAAVQAEHLLVALQAVHWCYCLALGFRV